jgi:hypothetical protein
VRQHPAPHPFAQQALPPYDRLMKEGQQTQTRYKLTVAVPKDLVTAVRIKALHEGVSLTSIVTKSLTEYLGRPAQESTRRGGK